MTTLKVGIADYDEMKARTMRIARGEEKHAPGDPKVWFTSTESFAKVLSAGNRELLRVIAEHSPGSLEELAEITGRWRPTVLSAWSAATAASWHPKSCMTWLNWNCP
jgi:predicted transcriptional regulator